MAASSSVFQKLNGGGQSPETRKREFAETLEKAGIEQPAQQVVFSAIAFAAVLWLFVMFVMRPGLIIGIVLLPLCAGGAALLFSLYIKMKTAKRLEAFTTQLEMALRLISSGVRIGLGLRQALAMVIEEMPNPAKYEYLRVIGQTNIGISVYDALDTLAKRMPSNETMMMARAIRIQSQTGGDLGKILDHLANTIKERRRIQRKIRALTAEGRASAGILVALPPFMGGFISLTEPTMGHALLFTNPGHVAVAIVCVLEGLGIFFLARMLKVDV